MAERNPPVWMQSGTYNAADDRAVTGLLVDRTLTEAGALKGLQGGVVPGTDQLRATVSGSTMDVVVAPGTVIVPGRSSEVPGAYVCHNQTPTTLTLAPVVGNPRWDLVVAEVEDVQAGSDENVWRIRALPGTPSASGPGDVAARVQAGTMVVPLFWVKVIPSALNGGQNKINPADITDLRQYVASMGGVHVTEAASPNPDHSPGRLVYSLGSDHLYISDGSSWQYFMTYQAWEQYFAAHRPDQASGEPSIIRPADNDKWTDTPVKKDSTDANNRISPVQVSGMKSPTGRYKVTLSAYGRVADVEGSGQVGVSVIAPGGDVKMAPTGGYRGMSFYSKAWAQVSITFLTGNLDPNVAHTFRMEFKKTGKNNNTVSFSNPYVMVEPIL